MTKKHFEWAAAYVRRYHDAVVREVLTDVLADLFTRFGPRFDEARFRAACRGDA
jgi:hypothetical protein